MLKDCPNFDSQYIVIYNRINDPLKLDMQEDIKDSYGLKQQEKNKKLLKQIIKNYDPQVKRQQSLGNNPLSKCCSLGKN